MATINIANLTFTHKGDYDGSTAYVKNDVVYYSTNGNAYIAKQGTTGNVPTNGTYWSQFSAGSGGIWNAGLSLGSANQVAKVNAAGNALEFGDLSSDFVKIAGGSTTATSSIDIQGCFSTDYKIYKLFMGFTFAGGNYLEVGLLNASDNSHNTGTYYTKGHGEVSGSYSGNSRWSADSQNGWNQTDNQGFRPINTWQNNYADEHSILEMNFDNPIASRKTLVQSHCSFSQSNYVGTNHAYGMLDSTNSISGLKLASSGGSNFTTTGYYALYGLKN